MALTREMRQSCTKYPKYETYFNKVALRRTKTPLRDLPEISGTIIFMAGGYSNLAIFPIVETEITLKDGVKLKISEKDMKIALQYGESKGIPELINWLTKLVGILHNPPTLKKLDHPGRTNVIVVPGCQWAINACFNLLLEEGDTLLVQNPSYATMYCMVLPLGCNIVGVNSDEYGINLSEMRDLLRNWEDRNPLGKTAPRPRVFYCVPTGENPRSTTWSNELRQAIYQICREFDLLIMEDDAYYMTFYTRPLPPSLLSYDEDGRVIRFDSFSKSISPGMRLGYVSGPAPLVDKIICSLQTSAVSANQLSQITLLTILRHWGYEGYFAQCLHAANILKQQASYILKAADTYLSDVAEWKVPTAGMFLWVKLKRIPDSRPIVEKCAEKGLLIVYGASTIPLTTVAPYIRIAFGAESQENINKACQILAEVARKADKLHTKKL